MSGATPTPDETDGAMNHSVIDTKALGQANNRYGPTAARSVSTEPIRLKTTTVDCHAHVMVLEAATTSGRMATWRRCRS